MVKQLVKVEIVNIRDYTKGGIMTERVLRTYMVDGVLKSYLQN